MYDFRFVLYSIAVAVYDKGL